MQKIAQIRIPTTEEWDRMMDVVHEDNSIAHWRNMFSWVCDLDFERDNLLWTDEGKVSISELPLGALYRAYRGYGSARRRSFTLASHRIVYLGFRPAIEGLTPDALTPNEHGTTIIGTLFMDGKPVKVPQNPTWNGDIVDYVPSATLTIGPALNDPAYQVKGIVLDSGVVIADRTLLKNISYEDIEKALTAPKASTETIITLLPIDVESCGAFEHFYELVAQAIGYDVTSNTTYDCRRIRVAQNIQDAWYRYYESRGYDATQISMNLCLAGAKVDHALADYEVAVEPGFVYEAYAIRDVVRDFILEENDNDKLTAFCKTMHEEITAVSFSEPAIGRAILQAYADNDTDALLKALTGWDMHRLLKQADVLPEDIEIRD